MVLYIWMLLNTTKDIHMVILSGRKIDDNIEGTRELHNQSEKKNSVDFAIWKKASKTILCDGNHPGV